MHSGSKQESKGKLFYAAFEGLLIRPGKETKFQVPHVLDTKNRMRVVELRVCPTGAVRGRIIDASLFGHRSCKYIQGIRL